MKTIERASPILSAPRSRLDASRPDAPQRGELRAFARVLVELALQLQNEAEEDSQWTP
jgi:hypothetical protein